MFTYTSKKVSTVSHNLWDQLGNQSLYILETTYQFELEK